MESQIIEIIELLDNYEDINDTVDGLHKLKSYFQQNLLSDIQDYQLTRRISSKLNTFLKLQSNFQFNLCSYLLPIIRHNKTDLDSQLLCHQLIQGLLLIHHQSKHIFHRSKNMDMIVKCLTTSQELKLKISVISTLIHILIKDFINYRTFESCNGCSIIISNFKLDSIDDMVNQKTKLKNSNSLQQRLNFKIIEFLLFFLSDETDNNINFKSVEEKSKLFKKDFPEIDYLIENLNELK